MEEDGKIKIDKFDGHDFGFWKMQIEDYLYQKKLHEPLTEVKPTGMKAEDWNLLDRQALGVVSVLNKVFLNRKLVNTKMKAGASIADHVNEFNPILSRLMSVDIKFNDEVQALLLLSLLPESWSSTVTTVSGLTETTKLKFDNINDLILREDIRRKTSGEYSNSLLSAEYKGKGRKQDKGQKQNRGRSKSKKRGQSKNRPRSGKVRLADDKALDIAGVGDVVLKTSFGTRLQKFRFPFFDGNDVLGWVYQAESFFDVQKVTFKAVNRTGGDSSRLPSVAVGGSVLLADDEEEEEKEEGFRDQQLKVTKGSLVVARGNKRGSLYMVEVPSDGINATIDGRSNAGFQIYKKAVVGVCEPCVLGKQKKADPDTMLPLSMTATRRYEFNFLKINLREYSSREFIEYCAENGIKMRKTVPETPQQNGVAERINQTFNEREKSTRLHVGLPKMFWEDSVTTEAYLINRRPSMPLGFRILKEEWQGKEVSLAHLRVFRCDSYVQVKDVARDKLNAKSMKCTFIGYGSNEMVLI
ncbi:retrovirus-related pol polyprotein from transposon TNT 1-94 [Tanacetum coccineum]|uniref:Retrovirus-related pol polyprotein from transposon TNT 1-94 n=1 Tax=Tanacetum coccineum TaxID=301880 RepID=A0ABQ5J7Y5_9ASTR